MFIHQGADGPKDKRKAEADLHEKLNATWCDMGKLIKRGQKI
jgi:hypothetical protein